MNDTIAAIATAQGQGGIGIIRLSGPDSEKILTAIFIPAGRSSEAASACDSPHDPPCSSEAASARKFRQAHAGWESHRMVYGHLVDGSERVDEGMAVLMRAPRSYTREDVAEIHLHGGSFLLSEGLRLCLAHGARLADPGEFTRRAFENGRLDLSRAEAVMSMIQARSREQSQVAMRQLEGGAASFVREASASLAVLQAGIAACMDYPEEVSDEEGAAPLRSGLQALIRSLNQAVDEKSTRLLYDGLHVTLFGRPNAGKSSLLNALTGEDRAIVTDIPGTTRDVVEGLLSLGGVQVHLRDTAGLRSTEDPVERLGVLRSEKALQQADVKLLLLDATEALSAEDCALLERLRPGDAVILTKSDLPPKLSEADVRHALTASFSGAEGSHPASPDLAATVPVFPVSIYSPASLDDVKQFLRQAISLREGLTITQPRHLEAVRRCVAHLRDALQTLDVAELDLVSVDLQAAQAALCEITGENATEKLLDRVFSDFCVGK